MSSTEAESPRISSTAFTPYRDSSQVFLASSAHALTVSKARGNFMAYLR
jgi:hypothetical protein